MRIKYLSALARAYYSTCKLIVRFVIVYSLFKDAVNKVAQNKPRFM